MRENKGMVKSAGVVGGLTLCSRILGFIRDIIIARLFGTGLAMEAFVIAFRIPNLLRDLVGEGAANSAVVPVLSESLVKQERGEFWRLTNAVWNMLAIALMLVTVLGIIFAPLIVRLIAPGFADSPEKLALTVKLTRIMFPFIFFIGLAAYAMGVLNTFKHFALPALGPCFLNISMIAAGIFVCPRLEEGIIAIAVSVLVGGILQLIMQLPVMYKHGWRIPPPKVLSHPAAKKIGKLLVPRMVGASIYQLNIFINTMLASLSAVAGIGAVAGLYYANRLVQFPLAIFGLAIATASLPTMSHHAAANEPHKLKDTAIFSLKAIFLAVAPSSVGLMLLARPIVAALFERGSFTSYSTMITAAALFYYGFGLFSYCAVRILSSCFYALQDTLTPLKFSAISLAANVILSLILMFPLKIGGLALATSISATINFILLYAALKKQLGDFDLGNIARFLIKVFFAVLVMALAILLLYYRLMPQAAEILRLGGTIIISLVIYIAACWFLRVGGIKEIFAWTLKKK